MKLKCYTKATYIYYIERVDRIPKNLRKISSHYRTHRIFGFRFVMGKGAGQVCTLAGGGLKILGRGRRCRRGLRAC